MSKEIVHIRKKDFPKERRFWGRTPVTQVTPSRKKYKRSSAKTATRKAIENGLKNHKSR